MLNYILPPIIIIISVSMLIMFLFRKVEQLPAQDFALDEEKNVEKNKVKIFSIIGEFLLKLMERMMHRSKLWSLKFHNASNVWFQRIREKRQRSERIQKENHERSEAHENGHAHEQTDLVKIKEIQSLPQAKIQPRPMVSDGMTMPQKTAMKEKNKLEEALIRRIAINPRDIEAYERLGDYYMESENNRDALECFKQVLRLSPAHHKARLRNQKT